ncbi:MAG: hypothetical protein JWP07_2648, partial [Pseudonocardiales bacterium]|nr:hypothetical protein [Pseudonocardiales bacterium]
RVIGRAAAMLLITVGVLSAIFGEVRDAIAIFAVIAASS